MNAPVAERVKCFRFVRDIPYRIGLSQDEQDYCCATKTPMLQKLLAGVELKSRRICYEFAWADFGLPINILEQATSPECGHEYLEVFVPEKGQWVTVDPTWDAGLKSTGLPIADWDGLTSTVLAVKPTKTFSAEDSAAMNEQTDNLPAAAWQEFYDQNRSFMGAINNWLDDQRHSGTHA